MKEKILPFAFFLVWLAGRSKNKTFVKTCFLITPPQHIPLNASPGKMDSTLIPLIAANITGKLYTFFIQWTIITSFLQYIIITQNRHFTQIICSMHRWHMTDCRLQRYLLIQSIVGILWNRSTTPRSQGVNPFLHRPMPSWSPLSFMTPPVSSVSEMDTSNTWRLPYTQEDIYIW